MNTVAAHEVSFDASASDQVLARRIALRARNLYLDAKIDRDVTDITMDLIATHANGCPLDFRRLSEADDFNLMHDVGGIGSHIDRETGELTNCFRPRFAAKSAA
jgi:hypothetical protein